IAETGNSIGFVIGTLPVSFSDFAGNVSASHTFTAAELAAAGGGHVNGGSSSTLIFESAYSGNVDTMDSTSSTHLVLADDAGAAQTIDIGPSFQHDGC